MISGRGRILMYKKVVYMLSIKQNLIIFVSLALLMVISTFTCQDANAGLDFNKYQDKLKDFDIPEIQDQLQLRDEKPPDTIATRMREEINGLHVEVEYFEDEMDNVWDEVDFNRADIIKIMRYIEDRELHEHGTKLQNEETVGLIAKISGGVGTMVLGVASIFRGALFIWLGSLPDKLIQLASKHKDIRKKKVFKNARAKRRKV